MSMKSWLANTKLVLAIRVFWEKLLEAFYLTKYLSSGLSDWRKIESVLHVKVHALEKGMSIGAVKVGFGKVKYYEIIGELQHYLNIGGRLNFANDACSVLNQYVNFNKQLGADMKDVESSLENFITANQIELSDNGGVLELTNEEIKSASVKDFAVFSQIRYSVRDFGKEPILLETIKDALKMCERTPSACNRQSWRIHIYSGDEVREKLFDFQGGNKGFSQDMQYAILVCGDMNRYRFYELSQVYVDGGLYAMNLMYALNFKNVATIPLTMSMRMKKVFKLHNTFNVPKNELPVILIGAGSYKDRFRVAKSNRYSFNDYTVFDK